MIRERVITQARQWLVLVRYKDELGADLGKQYVTATSAYEAIQMNKALYRELLISDAKIFVGTLCKSLDTKHRIASDAHQKKIKRDDVKEIPYIIQK